MSKFKNTKQILKQLEEDSSEIITKKVYNEKTEESWKKFAIGTKWYSSKYGWCVRTKEGFESTEKKLKSGAMFCPICKEPLKSYNNIQNYRTKGMCIRCYIDKKEKE